MSEYLDKKFNEIPKDFLKEVVEFLEKEFTDEAKEAIRTLHKENGEDWAIPFHSDWGMGIRNALRQADFVDRMLPDNNWDDYYIQVVEAAVGIRKVE